MKPLQRLFLSIVVLSSYSNLHAQYNDYIGRGHDEGVTVTASDNHQTFGWTEIAAGENTLNGHGLDAAKIDAARFLSQATFGGHINDIEAMVGQDYGIWIEEQVEKPYVSYLDLMHAFNAATFQQHLAAGQDSADYFGPSFRHVQYAWWQLAMNGEDLLRERMAYALSQILVVSFNSILDGHPDGVADYYDILVENAFGNYKDILSEVTLHPAMGAYLTHINNPKNIDSLNIHPDENYAREIMQLFSIGLYELNTDGTYVLDGNDNPIPTYDLGDINEMAKVFTGLAAGAVVENPWVTDPYFGVDVYLMDWTQPMAMYEEWHEQGPKNLMNGYTIPGGQSGMEDIDDAVQFLFDHQNVGPFLARRLIQHFVKSNPTPGYVNRVASVFNNNGNGERGDLLATLKAILLDTEARDCDWVQNPEQGKLREPFVRYVQFCRSNDNFSEGDVYFNIGYGFLESTDQAPLIAPTVFNFFQPDYQPNGPIKEAGLYGPEYQIHNSRTSISFINEVNNWAINWAMMSSWDYGDAVFVDVLELERMARDPNVLLDHLDVKYTHGQMSPETRENIISSIEQLTGNTLGPLHMNFRARMALYLVMISPDYAILK